MPTSRLHMENANGRWVVEFELGGVSARREHFSEANFLTALDRIKNIYLNASSPVTAAEQEPVRANHAATSTAANHPVFPAHWTKQQIADFHAQQARKYGRTEPEAEQPIESDDEVAEDDEGDDAEDADDQPEEQENAAPAEGGAPQKPARKPRKPRQFAAPAEGGAPTDK
ncbi:MAG TPA: hypothetical protein VG897_10245 [Terriglobales bacterium]|nr:hypothetical protein [Terriglobales bacterium]